MSPFMVKWIKFSLISIIGCAFLGLVVYALLNRDEIRSSQVEPPLIAAPVEPLKRRPDNPGGMEIPNRDKMVFDLLDGDKTPAALSATVEPAVAASSSISVQKLLAQVSGSVSATAPAVAAAPAAVPSATVATAPVAQPVAAAVQDIKVAAPQPVAAAKPVAEQAAPAPKAETKPEPQIAEKPAPKKPEAPKPEGKDVKKAEAKKPEAKKDDAAKADAKGAWAAQVAAVNSKADAEAMVAKLKTLPGLKGLSPRIAAAPDGKHYRVQFTGLKSRDDAAAACAKVAGKTPCFPAAVK